MEYAARLWAMGERPEYAGLRGRVRFMRTPAALIDLVTIVPFILEFFGGNVFLLRLFRLARILALAKLGRYTTAMRHVRKAMVGRRHELGVSVMAALGILLVASTAMYLVEGGDQPEAFGSIPRAMWWAASTLTANRSVDENASPLPRVDDVEAAEGGEVRRVAGHQGEAVAKRGGGDQGIDGRHWPPGPRREPPPLIGDAPVHCQHPVLEPGRQFTFQPGGEARAATAFGQALDAPANLAQGQHADVKRPGGNVVEPAYHRRRGPRAHQFGNGAGIDQEAHSRTLRVGVLSRARSRSTSASGEAARKAESDSFFPARCA